MQNQPSKLPVPVFPVVSNKQSIKPQVQTPKKPKEFSKYTENKEIFDAVKEQVEAMIPSLMPNKPYTVKKICGNEFWKLLISKSNKTNAGRYINYLVKTGCLNLRNFPEKTSGNSLQYTLK